MELYHYLLIFIVVIIHIYIVYLEMILWNTKKGIKAFGLKDKKFADETKVLAANQGLYNGFLAAGLIWSMVLKDTNIAIFFLICVCVAGIYGAYSTKKIRILYIQTIPASIAILSIFL
ncbi:DUF1304 domain-containing protein [Polaribacter porphyrae]|uniref:DUF1304 domain-containing protein n=1 Tax=Polaribacter porphyrae TaxID=1137780 RepID=A0A2S7WPV8_9FLAO|nr:DUF1304 domain-containing protein [Polaribacter porphyrae]PQJ79486.1 hypothetical protein BTO18_10015 [Polaribacter porphyrae]